MLEQAVHMGKGEMLHTAGFQRRLNRIGTLSRLSDLASSTAHQVPPLAGGRLGGDTLTTTTAALRAVPLVSGALAAGVTNVSVLLAGEAFPLRPTTATSYLGSRGSRGQNMHRVGGQATG